MEKVTKSERETKKLAQEFAPKVKNGGVVYLYGELGAGKTTFVKAVAGALGINHRILSPTFTIFRQYKLNSDQIFYHIDLYRAESTTDLETLGLEDIFENPKNIVFIEWPDKLDPKQADFKLYFDRLSETERKISY